MILALFGFMGVMFVFSLPPHNAGYVQSVQQGASSSARVECASLAQKYNNKVFRVTSSDALKGQVGVKIDPKTCGYEVTWQTVFESSAIKKNRDVASAADYSYAADVVFPHEGPHPADGAISPIFANKDALPKDPFNYRVPFSMYATDDVMSGRVKHVPAIAFYHAMQQTGTMSQSTIDELLQVKEIRIYEDKTGDSNAAVAAGSPVATYHVMVTE